MKKKILVITNSFPKPEKPQWGIFIAQTLDNLGDYFCIDIINPVPWFPRWPFLSSFSKWYEFSKIPKYWIWNDKPVFYSRFLSIPKITQSFQTFFVALPIFLSLFKMKGRSSISAILGFYLYPEGVVAVFLGKIFKIPVILSARGSDINIEANHFWKRWQIKWAIKNAHGIVGVSRDLCRKIETISETQRSVRYIPNGVDHSKFGHFSTDCAREKLGIDKKYKVIIFVGRLDKVKGLFSFLGALHQIDNLGRLDFVTYIIGDGPLKLSLEEKSHEYGLQNEVVFTGMKAYDDIPLWLSAADLFCLPSLNEGQPNVILESLASGTPVVASNVGGIPDLITTTDVGFMFPPDDINEMTNAILKGVNKEWDTAKIKESIRGLQWQETAKLYKDFLSDCFIQ